MSNDPYSEEVRRLFAEPGHAGVLQDAPSVRLDRDDVRLELSALPDGDHVRELRFRAWGCPHLIAAAEAACGELEGRGVDELLEFSAAGLMQKLGVPVEKTGRILVLEDALRSLGHALRDGT